MAAIILPDRWRRQPSTTPELDVSNSITRDITSAVTFSSQYDAVTHELWSIVGAGTKFIPTDRGVALNASTAAAGYAELQSNPYAYNTFSALAIVRANATNADCATITASAEYGGTNNCAQFRLSSAKKLQLVKPGLALISEANTVLDLNRWYVVGISESASGGAFYVDGRDDGAVSAAAFGHGTKATIGANYNAVQYNWSGDIAAVFYWKRALSSAEMAELAQNPWQLFRKSPRVIYFDLGAGGGATIAGDSGTYALTGSDVSLKVGRKLAAGSGTYILTGTAAALRVGRKLAAASGSYSLSGTDAAFKRGYALNAESGSYTLSGTTVSLKAGRKLAADSGSYTLTGTDATLTYSPAGSYTLTAESGSYTLTGTAATLKVSRKLTADSGTYALTGTDVTLTRGFKITADSGTYTLTGSNVAFARTYRLPADSGSYALSGSPVSLSWSGEVVPVAPTHGGPSIYGKAVFREAEFKREYEREVSRIENERIRAIQMREDEEIVIIMAALAA